MRKKNVFILFLFWTFLSVCPAAFCQQQQTGRIILPAFGIVLDSQTKEPVSRAKIDLVDQSDNRLVETMESSEDGNFRFLLAIDKVYGVYAQKGFNISLMYTIDTRNVTKSRSFPVKLELYAPSQEETILDSIDATSSVMLLASIVDTSNNGNLPSLEYRVLLGEFTNGMRMTGSNFFQEVKDNIITEKTQKNTTQYYWKEQYKDYDDALRKTLILQEKGYVNAVVVPYVNGVRVSISDQEAKKLRGAKTN